MRAMPRLHIVWCIDTAKPVSAPMLYGQAAREADKLEDATRKAYSVLPCMTVTR